MLLARGARDEARSNVLPAASQAPLKSAPLLLSLSRHCRSHGLCLLLLLILAAAAASAPLAQASSEHLLHASDHLIEGGATLRAQGLLQQWTLSYNLERPDVQIAITYGVGGSAAIQRLVQGVADFAIVAGTSAFTAAQRTQYPDIMQFPLFTYQIAIVHARSVLDRDGRSMRFSVLVLARIFSGDITYWNDSAIAALNPDVNLPARPIQVVMGNRYAYAGQDALCTVFNRVDPDFSSRFPCSKSAFSPPSTYALAPMMFQDAAGALVAAGSTKDIISFCSFTDADNMDLGVASVQVGAGLFMSPDLLTAALPTLEVGFPLSAAGTAELTDARGPFAYPFLQYVYLQMSSSFVRSTCEQKANVLAFILWLYQSPTAKKIADLQVLPVLPAQVQKGLNLIDTLQSSFQCSGSNIFDSQYKLTSEGTVFGEPELSAAMDQFLSLYSSYEDPSILYAFERGAEQQSYALINLPALPSYVSTARVVDLVYSVSSEPDAENGALHHSLPFATVSTRLLYSLPAGVAFSETGPVILDLDTLALIYTGQVQSWLHPAVSRLNPRLTRVLRSRPDVSATLTVVTCCSQRRGEETMPALNVLRHSMMTTEEFRSSPLANVRPLDWTVLFTPALLATGVNFIQAVEEGDMGTTVLANAGSVGYDLSDSLRADDKLHVLLLPWKGTATEPDLDADGFLSAAAMNTSVTLSAASSGSCVAAADGGALDLEKGWMDYTRPSVPTTCWPLTLPVQLLVPQQYSDSHASALRHCARALKTLKLARWLSGSALVGRELNRRGLGFPANQPGVRSYVLGVLESIQCDSRGIFAPVAIPWIVSSALVELTRSWSALGVGLLALAVVAGVVYRTHPLVASSGPGLLFVQATGQALLFVAAPTWIEATTDAQCEEFIALLSLGFTLAFVPLILKTYRVGRMQQFALTVSAKASKHAHKRQSKLTDSKLLLLVGLFVALDTVCLAAGQAKGMLGLKESTLVVEGGDLVVYRQCAPGPASAAPLGALLAVKAVLVLWGTLLSFDSTSSGTVLSPEYESGQQAYALYNLLFSCFIIVPILFVLTTTGDALQMLVMVLVNWSAFIAVALTFGTKAYVAFGHRKATSAERMTTFDDSHMSAHGATSELAATHLALDTLTSRDAALRYLLALDKHIVEAKRRLKVLAPSVNYRSPHQNDSESESEVSRSVTASVSAVSAMRPAASLSRPPSSRARAAVRPSARPSHRRTASDPSVAPVSQVRESSVRVSVTNNNYLSSHDSAIVHLNRQPSRPLLRHKSSVAAASIGNAGIVTFSSEHPLSSSASSTLLPPRSPQLPPQLPPQHPGPIVTAHGRTHSASAASPVTPPSASSSSVVTPSRGSPPAARRRRISLQVPRSAQPHAVLPLDLSPSLTSSLGTQFELDPSSQRRRRPSSISAQHAPATVSPAPAAAASADSAPAAASSSPQLASAASASPLPLADLS